MKEIKFVRGQKVFSEGVSKVDGLFLIRAGEFQVSQKIDSDKTKAQEKRAKRALSRKTTQRQDPLQDIQSCRTLRSHTML